MSRIAKQLAAAAAAAAAAESAAAASSSVVTLRRRRGISTQVCLEQHNAISGDVKLWTVAKGYNEPCRHLAAKSLSNVVTSCHNKML